jgi:RNA polymerase sigma-70 factor (ECF subfamily)
MEENIQSLAIRFVNTRDEKDFKSLYDRLKPGLLQHVYNILKNQPAAEDIIADAFVKMWAKIDQYNPHWNFSTWAYKIAQNEAMQWIRKNGNVYSLESVGGDQVADRIVMTDALAEDNGIELTTNPDWYFDETEDKTVLLYNKVIDEIESLPELYREIMKDRELNGMKYEDISEKYGLELNTVKTRIKRAREKICKTALIED